MKFTLSWLRKFLNTSSSLTDITYALTDLGLEVEEIIDRSEELKNFRVGHIIKAFPHPDANKLQVCEVETEDGILQIVCGAANARTGLKVVLAPIGAIIPNGNFKIKESEIRGVKSYGMLCSAEELLIAESSDGIIELPSDAKVGEQFAKYYSLDDPMIHIDVTPNRADALSVYGIARDLAAKGLGELKALEIPEVKADFNSSFAIEIKDPSACKYFAAREIKNVKNLESPDWLKGLLNNIGVGSISAIVDITNYISYTFGQPMHAYDKAKLNGNKLSIKVLESATNFAALNSKQYELTAGDLVINDDEKTQCLAGIIGSADSACDSGTTNIILEAAHFDPKLVAKSGRKHNILTDSRHKFERNVNAAFTARSLDLATNMIISICGGEASQLMSQGNMPTTYQTINFPVEFFTRVTGLEIVSEVIINILQKLGFIVELQQNEMLNITVPAWRSDVAIKEDIVEEVMRIYGYDKLVPIELPRINIETILLKDQRRISEVKRILSGSGYIETISWSFMDKALSKLFTDTKEELTIQNPISSDLNYMRPSIIPNLLKALAKNLARSIKDLALFEVGPVFTGKELADEKVFASGIRAGLDNAKSAHIPAAREVDIFDIKADLEAILNSTGLNMDKCQINPSATLPYYHPTRSAALQLGNNILGYFGELHPNILKIFDIDQSVFAFELNLTDIPFKKSKFGMREEYDASDFQNVIRDFAFIISDDQSVGEILSFVRNTDKKLIKSVELFDIYTGDKIEPGTKSIAISVNIQAGDKTLTEQELTVISKAIIDGVSQKFNGRLR